MGILKKIMTAIRGSAREVGESIVDANAIRILEQEVKDAETNLRKAKHELTGVMAQKMQAERKVKATQTAVREHEGYAAQALAQNNEALALEIAEKIAGLEGELKEQQVIYEQFSNNTTRLKEIVKQTERTIADHKRQLSMVKTTDKVQKATATITDTFSSSTSSLMSAKESLERIKQRQQDFEDRTKASAELGAENADTDLQEKLKAAGIGEKAESAQSVLDRIKAKGAS